MSKPSPGPSGAASGAPASPGVGGGAPAAHPALHPLAFRVMRLCKPCLAADAVVGRVRPADLLPGHCGGDKGFDASAALDRGFVERWDAERGGPYAASGALLLPQSFGAIFLGETFQCFVSVGNASNRPITGVEVKAELQTEKARVGLYSTPAPLPSLAPGARHDFIASHDIKEFGAHTLVCSTVYTDADGERKYLPQYFKFTAANPISVRTKVRAAGAGVNVLEATIENATKAPLCLNEVRLDPAPALVATPVGPSEAPDEDGERGNPVPGILRRVKLVPPGGARAFLFRVEQQPTGEGGAAPAAAAEGSNTLGKLEIRWGGTMGESGRLQTQQILGAAGGSGRRDVELRVEEVPLTVTLEEPFPLRCVVRNCTERRRGPLRVAVAPDVAHGVAVEGPRDVALSELAPGAETTVTLRCVALRAGVQRLPALAAHDASNPHTPLAELAGHEVVAFAPPAA